MIKMAKELKRFGVQLGTGRDYLENTNNMIERVSGIKRNRGGNTKVSPTIDRNRINENAEAFFGTMKKARGISLSDACLGGKKGED